MKSTQATRLGVRNFKDPHPAVDPLLKQLHALLLEHPGHVTDLYAKAGVGVATPRRWFAKGCTSLSMLIALANALGYELTLRRKT